MGFKGGWGERSHDQRMSSLEVPALSKYRGVNKHRLSCPFLSWIPCLQQTPALSSSWGSRDIILSLRDSRFCQPPFAPRTYKCNLFYMQRVKVTNFRVILVFLPSGMTTGRCFTTRRSVWYPEDGGWVPFAS